VYRTYSVLRDKQLVEDKLPADAFKSLIPIEMEQAGLQKAWRFHFLCQEMLVAT
jgi:hypothetical protein